MVFAAAAALLFARGAAASEPVPIPVRGKTVTVEYYRPDVGTSPKGTIFMGSGDVGWVGLGVELAEFLSRQGYAVVGINVRTYLEAFSAKADHVSTGQVGEDYAVIATYLRARRQLPEPVVVMGVSEGAALAVLAAAAPANHAWIAGVMTLGLPADAELAWRWKDALTWITKKNAAEPSFAPAEFIDRVSPLPLWMIQSKTDEYVPPADYRLIEQRAKPPKMQVLIDAANHRFTDRKAELKAQVLAGLAWMKNPS